ncbi:tight adherence pilus pseudopilin TadF [Vibrio bivalvicida]|uniref:ATP-binding protein n=1 Tax=Vibrio bivalvicida TaxID=1276888 RepID=A0A177Y481_9VIBR|nr:tight adherence pilus pseudopilin TadF [Vibrio bivalvicida]OAJ95587.1 ATP-binding protein [Vibrio bivalvicida]
MINSKSSQRGVFSIEFALLGVVFSTILIFTADIIVKLSVQGKLDRLSYSLVNVIKERTQFYGKDNFDIDNKMVTDIYQIATGSMQRTMGSYQANNVGGEFELLKFDLNGKPSVTLISKGKGCSLGQTISQQEGLSMVTSWGRRATLYRVTLCYETDNWAGPLFDEEFTTIQSSSLMMGR